MSEFSFPFDLSPVSRSRTATHVKNILAIGVDELPLNRTYGSNASLFEAVDNEVLSSTNADLQRWLTPEQYGTVNVDTSINEQRQLNLSITVDESIEVV